MERGEIAVTPTPTSVHGSFIGPVLPDHVWECMWDNCDYMFEDQIDCLEHAVADSSGHVASSFAGMSSNKCTY